MGNPAKQRRVLAEAMLLDVFGQINAHGPSAVLRQVAAESPQSFSGAIDHRLVVGAQVGPPGQQGGAVDLNQELGNGRLAVAGSACDDDMARLDGNTQSRPQDVLSPIQNVSKHRTSSSVRARRNRQVDGDLLDGDASAFGSSRLVEVNGSLAHESGAAVATQTGLQLGQWQPVGEVSEVCKDIGHRKESVKGTAHTGIHGQQAVNLICVPDTPLS